MTFTRLSRPFVLCLFATSGWLRADVTLPAIFSEHMVLQKTEKVPIWGKADPGEEVTISLNGQSVQTKAGEDGKWKTALNLKDSAAGPFVMVVKGKNEIKIPDVVIGEVWLASGQSNMEWPLSASQDAEKEIAASANPLLRQFQVVKAAVPAPAEEAEGKWMVAGPETSGGFTAVGYYFGQDLQKELQVPVGILYAPWGGTPIEAWTSEQALDTVPDLKARKDNVWKVVKDYPTLSATFLEEFPKWAAETGREDKKTEDVAAFLASKEGWVPFTLPGSLQKAGLPDAGVVWLRKTVEVPADRGGKTLRLELGNLPGYASIYWNGTLIKEHTPASLENVSMRHNYHIPGNQIKAGTNQIAVRLYNPVAFGMVSASLQVNSAAEPGDWEAKKEIGYASLSSEAKAKAPTAPDVPPKPASTASFLFNGMIHPLIPYAMRGVIWYQGETNGSRGYQYRTSFPLMIKDWRDRWGQESLPFYFCQLAGFMAKTDQPGDSQWAELREAQNLTLKVPQTGQAVTIDVGEANDIHPRDKKTVGTRLAKIAQANDYSKKIPFSGPIYKSMKVEGDKIRLTFTDNGGGLAAKPVPATHVLKSSGNETAPLVRNSPNSQLEGFSICGADQKWGWAEAKIEGDDVLVWAASVPSPVAVRYNWANNPNGNLYNGADLPASPFRTDDFPITSQNNK